MLLSRFPGAWPYCADYSSGKLKVAVDVWDCEVYGVFVVKAVDQNQKSDNKMSPHGFRLSNNTIQDGLFVMNGVEYEIIVGSLLEEEYHIPAGQDNFFPLIYQHDNSIGWDESSYLVFDLPIKKAQLKNVLSENECLVVTTHGDRGLTRSLESVKDNDPEQLHHWTEASRIGWETEGVTIYTDRYLRDGICEHKIPWSQKLNVKSPKEVVSIILNDPFTPTIMFCCVMVLLGILIIKLSRLQDRHDANSRG